MASTPTFQERIDALMDQVRDIDGHGYDTDTPEVVEVLADNLTVVGRAVKELAGLVGVLAGEQHSRTEPYVERFAAPPQVAGLEIDTETLGSALERGLDSMARDLKDGLESGLGEIAVAVRRGLER